MAKPMTPNDRHDDRRIERSLFIGAEASKHASNELEEAPMADLADSFDIAFMTLTGRMRMWKAPGHISTPYDRILPVGTGAIKNNNDRYGIAKPAI